MSTEERDEAQQPTARPRKAMGYRENADDNGRPFNAGYNRQEGNYERRPYNRPANNDRGGYRSYGDRPSYNDYGGNQGYQQRYANRGGYGNNRPYGNNRNANYNNPTREGGYNPNRQYGNRPAYNPNNDQRTFSRPVYSRTPNALPNNPEDAPIRRRRPRVGERRLDNRGAEPRPYGNNYGGGNAYGGIRYRANNGRNNFNRRPNSNNRRPNNYNPNVRNNNFQNQLKYKEVLADPNEPIRLNKFLSNAGVCSRREADGFIQAGNVKVNDVVVTELGTKITRSDKVTFNDKPVMIESKVYILLNKPKNCVTTSNDPQERLTVMDLVKHACSERVYPVGRLDRNTTGVLLLTNDGDLASKLTHPSFKKKKIYHVWLDKNVSIEDMEKIANGLELEDGEIHADAISYASETDKSQVGIEIHSGRNRVVRRIFESLGYHVVKLDRVYFAGLTKKNLGRGKWRYLSEKEVNALRMGAFE